MADRADPLSGAVPPSRRLRTTAVILAVAVLQVAGLGWFLVEPLPNAANIGGQVRRWILLARAIPEVVPGVSWSESHLGLAAQELSHVENLPERIPIVLAAALIAAAAVGLGRVVLRWLGWRPGLLEAVALAYPLGATLLGVLTLIGGRLGLLAPWPVRLGLGAIFALSLWERVAAHRPGEWPPGVGADAASPTAGRPSHAQGDGPSSVPALTRPLRRHPPLEGAGTSMWARVGMLLVVGPFLGLMALAAMLPTIDFDALEYHLQGPKEFYLDGRVRFLPHNVYTSMPFGVEMLHLLGMHVLRDWWRGALVGQLLVMLFAPAAAVLIAGTARRVASKRAGWVAAVVYLTTPWIYRLAAIPYVEGPLASYHAALLFCALATAGRARVSHSPLIPGLLAGGAMACKYPALISAVIPFGALVVVRAWRERSVRGVFAFGLGLALTIGPWLVKNVVDAGNPVYPLGFGAFGGRDWDAAREAKWTHAHGRRPVAWQPLVDGVLDIAGRSDWQSPLYTALAPLALLRRGSRRAALALWGYALYLFATWWLLTHRLDRFWLPILPPLAILAGVGADWVRSRLWAAVLATIMAVGIATNLVDVTTALAGLNQWTDPYASLRVEVPRMLNAPLARLDATLPPDAVPLLVGQASVFHMSHRPVYNTVFDREILETIARDHTPEGIRVELRRRGITHVYVDWSEIERHRKPGGYGFTDFVTPELFADLVRSGVLDPVEPFGPKQELYRVR